MIVSLPANHLFNEQNQTTQQKNAHTTQ